jgi:LPXTG-motif cell wall-anchored protein
MGIFAILPQGSVRDETTFFILLAGLAALVAAAVYLRVRRRGKDS